MSANSLDDATKTKLVELGRKLSGAAALQLASACCEEGSDARVSATLLRRPALVELVSGRARATSVGRAVAYFLLQDPKQVKRLERAREVASRSGCIKIRRARATGTEVGLYRSKDAGIESDPEYPWTTVCEEHGACVCHEKKAGALLAMACPDDWCDECRSSVHGTA